MSPSIVLMFVGGLVALVLGAGWLVRGAAKFALSAGVSPLVVGLTVVAFGTSAPEMAVSAGAALDGKVDIAIGNVVGSNILNVLLILGASALIAPLLVHLQLIRQEVPIMIAASVALLVMVSDGVLSNGESALLLIALVIYTVLLVWQSRRQGPSSDAGLDEIDAGSTWDRHWLAQVALIVAGLAALVAGSNLLVEAAVSTARYFGVSDMVIALTIVALGTSLPELATSVTAAWKGQRDIAVGKIVGSNTFNILGCLGVSGVLSGSGLVVAESVVHFDVWVMLAVALACWPIFITGREIGRWKGVVMLVYYIAYTAYLILASQAPQALSKFSGLMWYGVVPLTVIALGVSVFLHTRALRAS